MVADRPVMHDERLHEVAVRLSPPPAGVFKIERQGESHALMWVPHGSTLLPERRHSLILGHFVSAVGLSRAGPCAES